MKNNTKLIMETWRRFLSEGSPDDPGHMQDPDEPVYGEPLDGDEDLEVDQPYYSPASEEPVVGFYDEDYNPQGFDPDAYYSPASEEPTEGFYDEDYNPQGFDPDASREMSPRDRDRQFRSDYDDAIESDMSHDEAMEYLDSDESYNF